jgi:hypothetical protein
VQASAWSLDDMSAGWRGGLQADRGRAVERCASIAMGRGSLA